MSLHIAIISTDYPPLRTSAASQLRDLASELSAQGHRPVVIVPSQLRGRRWTLLQEDDVEVLRLDARETRASSHIRRALAEAWLPFAMLRNLYYSPHSATRWDVVVWYSPPIFLAPLVAVLKRKSRARTYLILRDIFPEWALDVGVLKRGAAYLLLKLVASLQYMVADVIGVQTPANLDVMTRWQNNSRRVEVLHNWLTVSPNIGCPIRIAETALAGRTIFAYTGNIGVAQGADIFLELMTRLHNRPDIGFVFVGRGSEFDRMAKACRHRALDNVLFFDEIDSREIPGFLSQCHIGIVALHPDHKTHNIPGKFVSYVRYGLPVLARVNSGNDLVGIIRHENIGLCYEGQSNEALEAMALQLADSPSLREEMSVRARHLGIAMFSSETAAVQVAAA